jgi:predicted nucleotidyltransferase
VLGSTCYHLLVLASPKHAAELELVARELALDETVELAFVFGSVARGYARSDSDLDLAVRGSQVDVLELAARLSQAAGREVHVVRLEDASIPLLEELIDDAILVRERGAGAAALWRSRTLADLELDRPWYARQRDAWLEHVARRGI